MIAVIGAGGHGKVVAEILQLTFPHSEIVIFDDAYPLGSLKTHWPVLDTVTNLDSYKSRVEGVVVGIGNNKIRIELSKQLENKGYKLLTAIHPEASISRFAHVLSGSVVMAGAIINTDAVIGSSVIVNTGSIIEHDCVVDDGCHLSPNSTLAGGCKVGSMSWLGVGSSVKQLVQIGRSVVVGAGAVVIEDVSDNVTVAGIPAKTINIKD